MNPQGWPKDCTNEIEMLIKAYKLGVCAPCAQIRYLQSICKALAA